MTKAEAIRQIRNGEWRKLENNNRGNIESIYEIVRQIDEPKLQKGEPTEIGEYLIEFPDGSYTIANLEFLFGRLGFVLNEGYELDGKLMLSQRWINTTSVSWRKIESNKEEK